MHRICHIQKSGKKNTETDCNSADLFGFSEMNKHDQHNADNECDRSKGGRLEYLKPGNLGFIQIQKTDNLAGNSGSDVCADNNADGLPK